MKFNDESTTIKTRRAIDCLTINSPSCLSYLLISNLVLVVGVVEFVAGEFAAVHLVPAVGDVGQHEGNEDTHDAHHGEGELAGRAVA